MPTTRLARAVLTVGALSSAALPLLAAPAAAQSGPIGRTVTTTTTTSQTTTTQEIDPRAGSYAPPDQRGAYYPNGAPLPDPRDDRDAQGYYANGARFPEPAPPPDYDGTRPPPPPPGYQPYADERTRAAADDRYAMEAERWARENCVKSQGDTAGGALLGGLLGAIVGSAVAGHHDAGAGALIGGAFGAVGGAAVASSANGETSPGCPPGYRVRREAVRYSYAPDYEYAAPGWYRPWVFIGGTWSYRPYPYHDWYYRTYRGRPYGGYGGGYRRGPEPWRGGHGWEHRRGW